VADHDQNQPDKLQPVESLSEWILKDVKDAVRQTAEMKGTGMDVADDRSGQLPPSHSPTHRDAGDGQPSGWVRAKSLAEDLPPSITESILGNSQAVLSQPEPVLDLSTLGVGPQASVDFPGLADTLPPSITESILGDPQALWPSPGPSQDFGPFGLAQQAPPQASIDGSGLADTPPSITESILGDTGRHYQPPEPGPEPQPGPDHDKGLDR
jgi:hypothetical protein